MNKNSIWSKQNGPMFSVMHFMSDLDIIHLQKCNKKMYDIIVP